MKQATIKRFPALDYFGNEALNTICSNLSFSRRAVKSVLMTSCAASEGKSFVTMQIARNFAKRGRRVCVVDCDMRRSFLVKKYAIETDGEWTGLAHYLVGYSKLDEVLYATNINGLYIVPAGRDVANPLPLLDTQYFAELIDHLSKMFDLVLLDTPPLGLVIDAAEIARNCDGAVFVVEYNKTRRKELGLIRNQMEQAGCPVLGCVINKMKFDTLSSKMYYNKTYYNHYNSEYYHTIADRENA